jgi:L-ribulose-5-phosphate 3-epimerase
MNTFTRRTLLKRSASLLGIGTLSQAFHLDSLLAADSQPRFRIGACDWSIHQQNNVSAMETAKQIGLDGVQLSLGSVENDMHLRRKEVQEAYQAAAQKYGVQIGGLAIGELNNVPYKSDLRTVAWVSDSIDVAEALGVRAILLAFFEKGDLRNDPAGQKVVIERLQQVAPKAEKAGVILGIESWLSAKEQVNIIDAVGSKNVQVYYDVCNSNDRGYNIYDEIRWLGKERICEFHCKENGSLLGKGKVNFKEVRKAIDDIGYAGWLQIEGAVPEGAPMFDSYVRNIRYMRSVFPKKA